MSPTLTTIYEEAIGLQPKPSCLDDLLLAAYQSICGDYLTDIPRMLETKPYIINAVRRRVEEDNPIFCQPAVLLAYLAMFRSPRLAKERWPLTKAEQSPLLTDLGDGY